MKWTFWVIFLTWLAVGIAAAQREPPVLQPSKSWKLAFVRDGSIWVANGDGTDQRLLIKNSDSPAWSADKAHIAFAREGNVWVAQADGSRQRPLTFRWKREMSKRWCDWPNGNELSWDPKRNSVTFSHCEKFQVTRIGGTQDISYSFTWYKPHVVIGNSIFDVPLHPTKQKMAVRFDLYDDWSGFYFSDHRYPVWSKSGKKLAFVRNGDIWVAEGEWVVVDDDDAQRYEADVRRLAAVASYDEPTGFPRASLWTLSVRHLSWSPDEKYLAYGYRRLGGSGVEEIHLLDIEKGKDQKVIDEGYEPAFSPDGRLLAYSTSKGCEKERFLCIWMISLDGKTKQKLVDNAYRPAW